MSPSSSISCRHSFFEHLFVIPCCKKQAVLKKIFVVAFQILTLCIPFLFYRIASSLKQRKAVTIESKKCQQLSAKAIDIYLQEEESPARQALLFAKKAINQNRILPKPINDDTYHQPIDPSIRYLHTLYNDKYRPKLLKTIKTTKNPWENPKVLKIADDTMNIAYAIGFLTLKDLDKFTQSPLTKRTFAKALTTQDSYQYRTFFYCPTIYHFVRGALASKLSFPKSIPETHANLFYEKVTRQNYWNQLYNDYCDRIRKCVPEKELEKADGRHINWTQHDTGPNTFKSWPDTQPT